MIRSLPAMNAVYGIPQAFAWNIGTMTSTRSYSEAPDAVGGHPDHRVQVGRPVAVDDSLRVAGRAARVAHGRGLASRRTAASRNRAPRRSTSSRVVDRLAESRGVALSDDDYVLDRRALSRTLAKSGAIEPSMITTLSSAWLTT